MIELVKNENDFWKEIEVEQVKKKSRAKKLHPLQKEETLYKLLNGLSLQKPKINSVYSATYNGVIGSFFSFGVDGFKDDVKVEIRPGEAKYLKNTNIGDVIDILVIDIDDTNYFIKGSISTIYESRAHESLKSLEEDSVVMAYIRSMNPAGYDLDIFYEGLEKHLPSRIFKPYRRNHRIPSAEPRGYQKNCLKYARNCFKAA